MGGQEFLKSEKAGRALEGVAKLVTTTTIVYDPATLRSWSEFPSSVMENQRVSIPFELKDNSGVYMAEVRSIHDADELSCVMEMVWQEKILRPPNSTGSHIREYLLVLGTSIGVHGRATLNEDHSVVTLVPIEVNSSIEQILLRFEKVINRLDAGALLILCGVSLIGMVWASYSMKINRVVTV